MTIKCQNLGLNYIDSYSRLLHVRSGEFIKNRYKMIFKYAHDHILLPLFSRKLKKRKKTIILSDY